MSSMQLETVNPVRKLRIKALKPNTRQQAAFLPCSRGEDEALRQDLKENGLRDPVIVRLLTKRPRSYEILDGHRRVQQLQALKHREVRAVVRDDLVNADAPQIEATFLRFNLNRRQLHPLDKARHALRVFEIDRGIPPGKLRQSRREAEADLGDILEVSGRQLRRLLRILMTPAVVQAAVRDGLLLQVCAEKIDALPAAKQQILAERLSGLTDKSAVRAVVAEFLQPTVPTKAGIAVQLSRLVATLDESSKRLGEEIPQMTHPSWKAWLPNIEQGLILLHRLKKQLGAIDPNNDELAEIIATISAGEV